MAVQTRCRIDLLKEATAITLHSPVHTRSTLVAEFPEMARYDSSISTAVNADYAKMTTALSDNDEIAFLPPVSGG